MEDMGNTPSREAATCGHPPLNTLDVTQVVTAADQYATRHNPFVYFHSIIDDQPYCDTHVVNLSALEADLSATATTANYIFIAPDLCHDGHDAPCVDGQPGGVTSVNAFLTEWVPKITAAPRAALAHHGAHTSKSKKSACLLDSTRRSAACAMREIPRFPMIVSIERALRGEVPQN